jgi:histidyl-tRNA synthetase
MKTLEIDKNKVNELRDNFEALLNIDDEKTMKSKVRQFEINGVEAINKLISNDEVDSDIINLAVGSLIDLQVRDYAIGITSEDNRDKLINLWQQLAIIAPSGSIAPLANLCAIANYEAGNTNTASEWLDMADKDNPNYQLTNLIHKAIAQDISPEFFDVMRKQLHHKVLSNIYGNDDENN